MRLFSRVFVLRLVFVLCREDAPDFIEQFGDIDWFEDVIRHRRVGQGVEALLDELLVVANIHNRRGAKARRVLWRAANALHHFGAADALQCRTHENQFRVKTIEQNQTVRAIGRNLDFVTGVFQNRNNEIGLQSPERDGHCPQQPHWEPQRKAPGLRPVSVRPTRHPWKSPSLPEPVWRVSMTLRIAATDWTGCQITCCYVLPTFIASRFLRRARHHYDTKKQLHGNLRNLSRAPRAQRERC